MLHDLISCEHRSVISLAADSVGDTGVGVCVHLRV